MRRRLLILVLGVLALLISGTAFRSMAPQLVAPNLMALLLVWVAFHDVSSSGALLAFLLGLELDFSSGMLLGPWAGAYVIIFGLLVLGSRRIFIESGLVVCLAVFSAVLLSTLLYHVTLVLVYGTARFELGVVSTALIEAGLSAALAPLLFYAARRAAPRREIEGAARRVQLLRS